MRSNRFQPAAQFGALEEFRFRIRKFLEFSRGAARAAGLAPQQHQMLLVLAGGHADSLPHIRLLAERLRLRHNSTVELLNRLERRGLAAREARTGDRRRVTVRITPRGRRLLERLTQHHLAELRTAGPELVRTLQRVIVSSSRGSRARSRIRARRRRR
jgi:DNA-binding MarR family transcriptional regulator